MKNVGIFKKVVKSTLALILLFTALSFNNFKDLFVQAASTITIYVEKPTSWNEMWIWYDADLSTTPWNTTALKTTPGDMVNYRTGWYKKEITNTTKVQFLFNDGTWNNKLQNNGADFTTTSDIWITKDGAISYSDPLVSKTITVYAEKPNTWGEMWIWYDKDLSTPAWDTTTLKTAPSDMVNYRSGWYKKEITNTNKVQFLFNDGTWNNKLQNNGVDFTTTSDIWIQKNGTITYTDPVSGTPTNPDKASVMNLGALYTSTSTTFKIWSPDSSNVAVTVNGINYNLTRLADQDGYTDIYGVTVNGDLKLAEYTFKINGIAVRDPYGLMVKPGTNTNIVMNPKGIQPTGGWAARPTLTEREDSIIYEAHVRDFTIDSSSGVSADKKGKYAGMTQTGTTYNGVKTGIDHLKELGVTHIQLMPVYDFHTGMYNWGYDPENYNIPEEQFSQNPNDYEARMLEFKNMINEYHKNGIRVVMDVVYNHTYEDAMFKNITSKYYTGNNDSGCGNGINTGNAMVSRMIRDSLEYWVDEYNVDGFRFDLMGIFHYQEVKGWGEYLNNKYSDRNLLMYGEPWNGYWGDPIENQKVRLGTTAAMASGHVGVFNGKYREAIKGDNDGLGKGYMFNNGAVWDVSVGSRGGILFAKSTNTLTNMWDPMFAYDPEQSVNYISAHDNYDLWDKIKHVGYDNAYGQRVDRFGMGMIFTSQGIPFIHSGDEFLRTKVANGDWTYAHNSYNAPDAYNSVKWDLKVTNSGVYNYYKDAINLRKNHPGFRLNTWDEINNWMSTSINGNVITSIIQSGNNGDSWSQIAVVYNPGNQVTPSLPGTGWRKAFDINGLTPADQNITAEGTAVTVFYK